MSRPRVGIVGGGILGTALAYRLTRAGADVRLLEAGATLGGLAGAMEFGGHTVDRFYHVITPQDERMIATASELGLGDRLRFTPTGVGFFVDGTLHPLNSIGDFLRFRPLTLAQRARLAGFVAQCQVRGSVDSLDDVPLERWLVRQTGNGVYRRIWNPLLTSRFEGRFDDLPATYLWSRTRRMSGARKGKARGEQMGCLVGGHQQLVDAMAAAATADGATLETGARVESFLVGEDGGIDGVVAGGERLPFDLTLVTLQPPALEHLLPAGLETILSGAPRRWLGVVCLVLKVRRTLTPYYSINICEPTPITTVVEAAHVVGTEHTDGLRVVYVPRYCAPDAPDQDEPDASIFERYTAAVERIVPGFSRSDIAEWVVQRARYVEPVHALGAGRGVLPVWPGVRGLALASNAQIYPWLLNGESVIRMAESVAQEAAQRLGLSAHSMPTSRAPAVVAV